MSFKKNRRIPTIAIVGRSNVGKSTLWNRLTESGKAIVSSVSHTTRDRNYGVVLWRGLAIQVVDTGGMDAEQGSEIGRGILAQAELAIKEADIVLFVVDAKAGVHPEDLDLARRIQKVHKHVLIVANKVDTARSISRTTTQEMFALGLGEPLAISASTSLGIGDLLDTIYQKLEARGKHPVPIEDDEKGLKIVLMGRPNVGKSSIMNAILGEERVIVSPIPHTTREPQDTTFEWHEQSITIIDTAGMRKRSKISDRVESASIERNREALMRANVALLVLDATERPSTQDRHLAGILKDAGRGLILVVNKWDLVDDKEIQTAKEYEKSIRRAFPFLNWAPIIFVSAKERKRTSKILDMAISVQDERQRQITYNALQKFLKTAIAKQPPRQSSGSKPPFVYDITQLGVEPPTFSMRLGGKDVGINDTWRRFVENQLREKFGFVGTPLKITTRHMPQRVEEHKKSNKKSGKTAKHPWARKRRSIGRKGGRY